MDSKRIAGRNRLFGKMETADSSVAEGNSISDREYWQQERQKAIWDLLIFFAAVIIVAIAVGTAAWFASNKEVSGNNMVVSAQDDSFEIEVITKAEKESLIANYMSENGYETEKRTSASVQDVFFTLENENTNIDSKALRPGAYGTLQFYLLPGEEDYTLSFDIILQGARLKTDGSLETIAESDADGEVLDLLKGHILIFSSCENGKYSGRIKPGEHVYSYSTLEHSDEKIVAEGETKYPITFYWIWPKTFAQMVLLDGATKLHGKGIFDDPLERQAMLDDMDENPGFYFKGLSAGYARNRLASYRVVPVELSDAYNDADQEIGESVRYVVIELIAKENSY